jgi:hypothetical protein
MLIAAPVAMPDATSVDVLNHLLQVVYRSLPMYLAGGWPWTDPQHAQAATVLRNIIRDQEAMSARVAALIDERRGAVDSGTFPMDFTDRQFLALDYLLPELIDRQRQDIAAIEECVSLLARNPEARSLAEEALGAERAHLESLEGLLPKPV